MSGLFNGIFDSNMVSTIPVNQFMICMVTSILIGVMMAYTYMYKSRYTQSFVVTMALLPMVVCVVIMMVNGNIGAGVAVAGAFNLVRFRSVPGTAKEIAAIFIAMGAGLIVGMGYIGYAVLFTVIVCAVDLIYRQIGFGNGKNREVFKTVNITIPENIDYSDVFKDIFEKYTRDVKLAQVKTTNMGSLFRLTYQIEFKKNICEKEFIDNIRCRNGNLEITVSNQDTMVYEL